MSAPAPDPRGRVSGQRVRLAREHARKNFKQAAALLSLDPWQLQRWEEEGRYLYPKELQAAAERLGTSPEWLLGAEAPGTADLWARARRLAASGGPGLEETEQELLKLDPPDGAAGRVAAAKAAGKKAKA